MYPTSNEIKAHASITINNIVEYIVQNINASFFLDTTVNTETDRHSNGGRKGRTPYIMLYLHHAKDKINGFHEYKRYASSTTIGSFKTNDWKLYVDAIIAHEITHALIAYLNLHRIFPFGQRFSNFEGHGDYFQYVYSIFRKKFINDRVPYADRTDNFQNNGSKVNNGIDSLKAGETVALTMADLNETNSIGKHVVMNGVKFVVVEYRARNYKSPFIVTNASGEGYKISKQHLATWINKNDPSQDIEIVREKNEYVGKKVVFFNNVLTIIEYKKTNRRRPFVVQTENGKKYVMTMEQYNSAVKL